MKRSHWFNRDVRAQDDLELLLISAAGSLLLLRFGLYLSGYPQVGSGSLHIAHVLYGGLLLLIAVVIQIAFLGKRVQRLSALIGGAGFGVFIDELGKFITRDNNYFFRPTVGIIYAVFIGLYLTFNFLSRKQKLSSREYQLNALNELQEAVLDDMSQTEKKHVTALLKAANQSDPMTRQLLAIVEQTKALHSTPSRLQRYRTAALRQYQHFWRLRGSNQLISLVFVAQSIIFLLFIFITLFNNLSIFDGLVHGKQSYGDELIVGQLVSSVIAACFAVVGAVLLPTRRMLGYEWFRRATLITIFLTEFFIFTRIQFGAIPGFIGNVVLLAALNFAITQERRSSS